MKRFITIILLLIFAVSVTVPSIIAGDGGKQCSQCPFKKNDQTSTVSVTGHLVYAKDYTKTTTEGKTESCCSKSGTASTEKSETTCKHDKSTATAQKECCKREGQAGCPVKNGKFGIIDQSGKFYLAITRENVCDEAMKSHISKKVKLTGTQAEHAGQTVIAVSEITEVQ